METDTTESKTTGLAAGLENLIGARRESNGVVIFNPKEWPKFMVIVLALLVGYYLFNIILGLADFNNYDFIFTGHTHYPVVFSKEGMIIANPGSVGQPRDVGSLASYAILNTNNKALSYIFNQYNLKKKISINEFNKEYSINSRSEEFKKFEMVIGLMRVKLKHKHGITESKTYIISENQFKFIMKNNCDIKNKITRLI